MSDPDREAAQLQFFQRAFKYVTDWSIAIDGGANRGNWTAVMADKFAIVYAFEPAKDLINPLRMRFDGCGSVTVRHAALWFQAAQVSLLPDPVHPAKIYGRYVQPGGNIEAIAIDDLELPSCGLIKLDLEGAEMPALEGAERTLMRHHPVVVCECKSMAARFGASAEDPGIFLGEIGYREIARQKPDRIYAWKA